MPHGFRQAPGLEAGDPIEMRLVKDGIEISPVETGRQQGEHTEAEIVGFLREDRIDGETAAAVRRLLAEGAR